MKKVYIYSVFGIIAGLIIFSYVYYLNFEVTRNTFESALNSFIVNLVVLVFTVIVINILFSYQHERINKEKEHNDYIEVLKESHNSLVFSFKTYIITLVTKEMAKSEPDENDELQFVLDLTDLKDELDKYVTSDFFTKSIKVTKAGEFNLFKFEYIELKHTEWLLDNNNKILGRIHKHLMLYSKLMPNKVLKLLVELELIITRGSPFMVPDPKSFQNELNNNFLDDKSIKIVKNEFVKIIDKIIEFEKSV